MKMNIHPNAEKNINESAELVVKMIQKLDNSSSNPQFNHLFSVATLTDKDIIGEFTGSTSTRFDGEIGRDFFVDDKRYGLHEEGYKKFAHVASNVCKVKEISSVLSADFVKDNLFDWAKKLFKNQIDCTFLEYLCSNAKIAIKEHEIILPVPYTIIAQPFCIGRIDFHTLTEEIIDLWFANVCFDQKEKVEEFKLKLKKEFQGYAVGVHRCTAEQNRAAELAMADFINSLSVLRLVSPANIHPLVTCCAYEFGHQNSRSERWISYDEKAVSFVHHVGIIDKDIPWYVSTQQIADLKSLFSGYDDLITSSNLTPYQEKLLDATIIYSKNTLRYEVFDKILYIFSALESMLLKNENEPITQNIADRLAYIIGTTAERRVEIVSIVKQVYAVRSKFVHHGKSNVDDTNLLSDFMILVFSAFHFFIKNKDNFTDKEALLAHIDKMKYS